MEHNGFVWICVEYRRLNKIISCITSEWMCPQNIFNSCKILSAETKVSLLWSVLYCSVYYNTSELHVPKEMDCMSVLSLWAILVNSSHPRKLQLWEKRKRRLKRRKVVDGFQDFGALAKRARRRRNNQVRLLYFAIYFHLSVVSPKVYITLVFTTC